MLKTVFKVSPNSDTSVVSLIKGIADISCRIDFDVENGIVTVENVDKSTFFSVAELVSSCFSIVSISIDNSNLKEEQASKENIPANTLHDSVSKHTVRLFQSDYLRNVTNSFIKAISYLLSSTSISEEDVAKYLFNCRAEMLMKYSKRKSIDVSVGDVVDVSFGMGLPGEIFGGHVHAIVCHIYENNFLYVIPITKAKNNISSRVYLTLDVPQDVTYSSSAYTGGTALIDKSKYISIKRVNCIVGEVSYSFFSKLCETIATTFDFSQSANFRQSSNLASTNHTEFKATSIKNKAVEIPYDGYSIEELLDTSKKPGMTGETAILAVVGKSFDKLDATMPLSQQVNVFLNDIGMDTSSPLIEQAFIVACDVKKINFTSIALELYSLNPSIREEIIAASLRETFKLWLTQYPEISKKCPKISFTMLLKVFVKKHLGLAASINI